MTESTVDRFASDTPAEQVPVRFTETGSVGRVPAAALDFWKARGYEEITEEELLAQQGDQTIGDPVSPPITTDTTAAGAFDPTAEGVTAKAVNDYLTGLDTATPGGQAEYDRVVAAEKAGQNRSTAFPS